MDGELALITMMLADTGAVLTGDHFVYTSGRHGSDYVNKDALYPDVIGIKSICGLLAEKARLYDPQVVVGPALGGIILAQRTAEALILNFQTKYDKDLRAIYAEKDDTGGFVIRRGYDKLVAGKRVLVVEDVLTTGGSVVKVVDTVRKCGGDVVAVTAICNRGGVTAEVLGVPALHALVAVDLQSWAEDECPLCAAGVPVNVTVGKGRDFLIKKGMLDGR